MINNMKTTTLFFSAILIASAMSASSATSSPRPGPPLPTPDDDVIPEPEVQVETFDYDVDLRHLCPNAPSEEATQCIASYNLSQNVQQNLVTASVAAPDHLSRYGDNLFLTECSIEKIPDPQMSLEVFCYFKGVKEFLFKEFGSIESKEEFADLMKLLRKKIRDTKNPSYKKFLIDLQTQMQGRFNIVKKELETINNKGYVVSQSYDYKIDDDKYTAGLDQSTD